MEKSAFKGPGKWILIAACCLLTALLLITGVYYKIDQDSAADISVEQTS